MKKNILNVLYISLLISFFLSLFYFLGIFSNINLLLSNNLYGGGHSTSSIVIIGIDDLSLQEIGRFPWNRNVYSQVLEITKDAKVVGIDVSFFEESSYENDLNLALTIKNVNNVILNGELMDNGEILLPISVLKENALDIGYINILKDKDSVVRKIIFDKHDNYKTFSEVIYEKYTNVDFRKTFNYSENYFLINYVGQPGSFETYSFSNVYFGKVNESVFQNKIVLIGATAPGLRDNHMVPTSFGYEMAGVEIHANIIQNMLLGNYLKQENPYFFIFLIFLVCLFLCFIFNRLSIKLGLLLVFILIIIYLFLVIYLFNLLNLLINIIYIPLTIIVSYISIIVYKYVFEKKEKQKVIKAFSKYVSKDVVSEILKSNKEIELGGVNKRITIMFSDIRNFTGISEKLNAHQVIDFLNIYLSEMTNIILEREGFVDKYIGDAIMAFWGAPLENKNHAYLCCASALEMKKKLKSVVKKTSLKHFDIGVGIHTGDVVVGNIGSSNRLDYTIIGDSVNLSSRIEGMTKYYGVPIIISENTQKLVKNKFITRKIDNVKVKGKEEPVVLYELICYKHEGNEQMYKNLDNFSFALNLYFEGNFKQSQLAFRKIYKQTKDSVSLYMLSRIKELLKKPPKNWNGVFVMHKK